LNPRAGTVKIDSVPTTFPPRRSRVATASRRTRRVRLVALAAALFALVLLAGSAPVRADTQTRLNGARARVQELLSRIAAAQRQQTLLQSQLNALAEQISQVQSQMARTRGKMQVLQVRIAKIQARADTQQGVLDTRARIAYEQGPVSSLVMVLGSTSMADLNDRIELINAAANSDEQVIAALLLTKSQLLQQQAQLQALQMDLRRKQKGLSDSSKKLESRLAQQQSVLSTLERDKATAERLVSQLSLKLQRELASQIGGSGGGGISGVFQVCPVDPPRAYSDDFGAPRYTTDPPHPHAGNDIFAPRGTPIRAPFAGSAVVASGGLGGKAVVVYGALGYVYNAHLSGYGSIGSVSAGTVIGYVGNTGDARGGSYHDHFEWHPAVMPAHPWRSPSGYTRVGTGIDPYPYLNSVC
jgi:peptidoglycan LD-endopeptidase LytH